MSDTSLILADYYEQHHAESVFSRCAARQMIGIIEHRINQMDERIARVLRLNIMEQSPVSEIAEVLSIKYKTA